MKKNLILSCRKFLPDKFKSLSTIWYSVALPGFTLPVDVIPISDDVLKDLGTIHFRYPLGRKPSEQPRV